MALALTAAALLVVPAASGVPTPTVPEVERAVERLQHDAEVASEKYNETREQLASLTVRVKAAQVKLARQQKRVVAARTEMGMLAAETYRRGELTSLDYMLSDDPDIALAQAGLLPTLGERQVGATRRLQTEERELAASRTDLAQQQERIAAAKTELKAQRSAVLSRLAKAEAQLDRLQASERRELQQIRSTRDGAVDDGTGGSVACSGFTAKAPTARIKKVLTYACAQLGEPYQWAADGPGSWDCSGFTMMAWKQGGVSLPHSSRLQATYGTTVSLSNLQAGDLVFSYSPISHVGLYLGQGKVINAPSTGDVVKIVGVKSQVVKAVRL